jgi:dTDP-4-dehydrorhamnose reductase
MNVLVTGSNGQLGSEIKMISSEYENFQFTFKDLPDLDICNVNSLKDVILKNKINIIINCAAYTDVDKAEKQKELAMNVNSEGVKNLVSLIENVNGKLIHISTDYVFDGKKNKPYLENDVTSPKVFYGRSKLEGEKWIMNSNIDAIIIRTSWLYSSYGKNFVKTILKLGREKTNINVVSDQFGTPTYARDLAKTCLDILSKNAHLSKFGKIYHYSNEGDTNWADFARAIIKNSKIETEISYIKTKDYKTLTPRPKYSVLSKEKIKQNFKIIVPKWENSLKDCIKLLENE